MASESWNPHDDVPADMMRPDILGDVVERINALQTTHKATIEYPGYIAIEPDNWAFGTANDTWGGDNGYNTASIDLWISSLSVDVERIAQAIVKAIQ